MSFTIGSLFDGSGGFPLAATMCGGVPKWASEVEPYPIAVTKSRFPNVKHLGSVTDIKGGEIEPVDVITFGSPCQDLSVAGKRAGLKHEANGDDETTRSGLFMEAVRIIKEMREATNGVYPRFALWENVPGAFSSNKGEDFRIVLQELIQVAEPTAVMPAVPKNGWPYADSYCGDGWSIAYRVLDAQFWGVPQRRRRIYLVADFRGECAGKVSFEREGLRGYFETGRTPWETVAGDAEGGFGTADCERNSVGVDIYNLAVTGDVVCSLTSGGNSSTGTPPKVIIPVISVDQGGGKSGVNYYENKSPTLTCTHDGSRAVCYSNICLDDQGGSQISVRNDSKCPTLRAETHGNLPCVMGVYKADDGSTGNASPTKVGDHNNRVTDHSALVVCYEPIPIHDQATRFSGKRGDHCDGKGNGLGVGNPGDPMNTLTSGDRHAVAYVDAVSLLGDKVAGTLMARDYKGIGRHDTLGSAVCIPTPIRDIVRRLTPTECARLQGFPDTWGHPIEKTEFTDEEYQFWLNVRNTHAVINDKATKEYTKDQILKWYNSLHTDSSEYKMWGNGIALPNALYMMQGIADVMSEEKASRRKWLKDLLGDCL